MPIARHLGLRGRLILLLLAAFAVIFAMIVQHAVAHRSEKITNATAHLLHNAQLIAARQQHIVAQADAILNGLITHSTLRASASTEECSQALAARIKLEKDFVQIGKVLPNGDVACAAVPATDHVNVSDQRWFQQALKSEKMVISGALTGPILGKPTVAFAKAMRDQAGQVTGVLFLSLDLSWLRMELARTELPENVRLAILNGAGTVVARFPDPERWAGRGATHLSLFKTILASGGEGTLEETGLDGVRKMYAFTPLLETVSGRMVLYLSMPVAAITAPAQHELVVSLLAATTVLLLVLTLMYWGSETLLVRPLLALSRTITRFGSGDHAARCGPPYSDDEVGRLARTVDEVAETTQSNEQKLARANRALRVRSAGNLALLRAKGEQVLLEQICRAIVEAGGYRVVWVGYAKHDRDKSVRPMASWNAAEDFFDGPRMTWDETDSGRGPIGAAIRRGIPVVSNTVLTDPDYAWALRYGIASTLALPLRLDSAVIGVLCICAAEPDAFDEAVVELFSESAKDLAYGIATQRAEAEHERTRAELKRQQERNTLILNAAGEGIFGLDSAGRCTFINPAGAAMLQWTAEELAGQSMHAIQHHTRADGTPYPPDECPIYAAYKDGIIHRGADETYWRKDGTSFPVEYVSTPISDERGKPVGAVVTFDDITERKQAEEALRASALKHQLLFESSRDALMLLAPPSWKFTGANQATLQLFGASSMAEFTALWPWDVLPERQPDGRLSSEKAQEIIATAMREGSHFTEWECQRLDGRPFAADVLLTRMKVDGDVFLQATVRDITERKHQEEHTAALLELTTLAETLDEKTLLQQGLNSMQHLTGSRIGFLHFVSEDQNEIELVTWSTDTLAHYCHANFDRHYPVSDAGIWADCIRLKHPIIINDYATVPGKKGYPEGHADVQRFISVPIFEGTQVRMIVGVGNAEKDYDGHDVETVKLFSYDLYRIVQRKRAEEALHDSAEKFRAMGASAQDALIMIDNDGYISFWNAAAETIFGYSGEEALGRNLHDLLAPERFHEAQRMGFEHFRQSGEGAAIGKTLELAALRKGGAEFPVELSLNAVKIGGQWCAVGIMRDITQRKQAEDDLKREIDQHKALAHKLQETEQQMIQSEKMAAVGTLAAGVAHEINNPASYVYSNVVTLRGYIQRLMRLLDTYEKAGTLPPEEMRQAAEELESVRQQVNVERVKADLPAIIAETLEGIDRIIRIVGDLKDFSHLDVEESWQPADLNQALDTTLSVVWNELKYKAEIHKEYGVLPPVTCLIFQLNQVFMNLLVNAGQAIGEHGVITLRTGVAGEEVWVEIADTGRGIPQQHLSRIFEPFFTTKPAGSGTGLGLWVSHGIVAKHQGRIEVVSEEGVGTTFKVWLPVHPAAES